MRTLLYLYIRHFLIKGRGYFAYIVPQKFKLIYVVVSLLCRQVAATTLKYSNLDCFFHLTIACYFALVKSFTYILNSVVFKLYIYTIQHRHNFYIKDSLQFLRNGCPQLATQRVLKHLKTFRCFKTL